MKYEMKSAKEIQLKNDIQNLDGMIKRMGGLNSGFKVVEGGILMRFRTEMMTEYKAEVAVREAAAEAKAYFSDRGLLRDEVTPADVGEAAAAGDSLGLDVGSSPSWKEVAEIHQLVAEARLQKITEQDREIRILAESVVSLRELADERVARIGRMQAQLDSAYEELEAIQIDAEAAGLEGYC